ncbi:MAG: tetratricopeptide repeat protein [Ignavibacteriaceae bacterium]
MKKNLTFLAFAVIVIAGCNTKKDSDYKTAAEEHIKNGNVPEAIVTYDNLVKEFPESKLAPTAIYEKAALYQNRLVKNLSPRESLEKASKIYREVYEKYPDSEEAPKSLFMSGFILANELKKFREATETYNLFLSKYPEDKLAVAARQELDNMGLTPEEIINKKKLSTGT